MSEQCKEDMCNSCNGEPVGCSVMEMIKSRIHEINTIWHVPGRHEEAFLEALINQIKINKGVTPCPK